MSSDGWPTNKTEQVTFIVRNNSITGEPTEHVSNKAIDSDGKTVIVLSPSKQSHYNINNMMNKKDTWAVSCMQLIIWPSHSERNNENLLKIHNLGKIVSVHFKFQKVQYMWFLFYKTHKTGNNYWLPFIVIPYNYW